MPTAPEYLCDIVAQNLARGPSNPGLATGACVSSTKSILWQWRQEYRISIQVLLDDGNRIIIPQGNFNFFYQPFVIQCQ